MIRRFRAVITLFVTLTVFVFATSSFAGSLKIDIDQVRNSDGYIYVYLFSGPEGFDNGKFQNAEKSMRVKAKKGIMSATIDGLEPGKYAVFLYHDENNNSDYDYDGSVPAEGWGYSQNVGQTNFASFDQANFRYPGGASSIYIGMNY